MAVGKEFLRKKSKINFADCQGAEQSAKYFFKKIKKIIF
jgi:hypothetical protein